MLMNKGSVVANMLLTLNTAIEYKIFKLICIYLFANSGVLICSLMMEFEQLFRTI